MKNTTNSNNYTKERKDMCEEEIEEKLLNSDKDEYFNFLQNVIEELKK